MMSKIKALAVVLVLLICSGTLIRIIFSREDTPERSAIDVVEVNFETTASRITQTEKPATVKPAESAYIPESETRVYTETEKTTEYTLESTEFPLNLNTATAEELAQLPGIGEKTAAEIIAYRENTGGFTNRKQLLDIKGIGAAKYSEIYDLVYLDVETEYIYVPEEREEEEYREEECEEEPPPVIDINTAGAEDFAKLPGVDISLGQRIVDLRREIGGFKNKLELLYTEGMTDNLFVSIQEFLVCESAYFE